MARVLPTALPFWWRMVPFGDPVCALVVQGKATRPCGSAGASDAAARADLPWEAVAARAATGRTVDLLLRAADGNLWRLQREQCAGHICLRAEAIADSIVRAEQYLHFELSRRLADGLRHEMSGPLNVLSLNTQLLNRGLAKGEEAVAAALARTLPAMQGRLAELVHLQDRLWDDWHRMDEVSRPVDPAQLIEEVVQLCRSRLAGLPAQLDTAACSGLPALRICPWRLKWILLAGILTAAQRAGPEGALRLAAKGEADRLVFEMALHPNAGGGAASAEEATPSVLAAAGALVWGLAQGRDEFEIRADGGWRLSLMVRGR